jgi:uncharacterized protein (TIGR02001 family)
MNSVTKYACGALLAVTASVSAVQHASAADLAMPEAMLAPDPAFDVAFGVKFSSEYLVRGVQQTDGKPAISGYAEVTAFNWVYAGIWGSNVGFGGGNDPSAEFDIYGGVRHTFDKLTLDAGYVWVEFTGETPGSRTLSYGKFYGIAKYALTEDLTVGANFYWGDDFLNRGVDIAHATAFAKYVLPFKPMDDTSLYLSGSFSKQWTSKNFVKDYLYWDVGGGVTYKAMTVDLRYSDTNLSRNQCFGYIGDGGACGSRFLASVSFDTSFSALK